MKHVKHKSPNKPTHTSRDLGPAAWDRDAARAFLDAIGAPGPLPDDDRAIYLVLRDALVQDFAPSCATEALLIRDLSQNELQIWRLDQAMERLQRLHEPTALQRLADTYFPAEPSPWGQRQTSSPRVARATLAACARREPNAMRSVGDMMAEAHLTAQDVAAAALDGDVEQLRALLALRAGCEARRRALMADVADWRRGGLGAPPQVMARCARALKDALAAHGLKG